MPSVQAYRDTHNTTDEALNKVGNRFMADTYMLQQIGDVHPTQMQKDNEATTMTYVMMAHHDDEDDEMMLHSPQCGYYLTLHEQMHV